MSGMYLALKEQEVLVLETVYVQENNREEKNEKYISLYFDNTYTASRASLVAQMIKNLPAMWETCVQSLGWENPLEEGMAIYSSILPGESPWTEKPGELRSMGLQRVRHD